MGNEYICPKCLRTNNINYFDVSCASDSDPNPVVKCPICGEYAERIEDFNASYS